MEPTVFTIVAGLCTALLSGVVAALAAYLMNSRKDHIFFMRTKGEELYQAFSAHEKNQIEYAFAMYPVLQGIQGINHFKAVWSGIDKDLKAEDKANMLVRIYFPQLIDNLRMYEETRTVIAEIVLKTQRACLGTTSPPPMDAARYKTFDQAVTLLIKRGNEMKDGIVEVARSSAGTDALSPMMLSRISRQLAYTRSLNPDGP